MTVARASVALVVVIAAGCCSGKRSCPDAPCGPGPTAWPDQWRSASGVLDEKDTEGLRRTLDAPGAKNILCLSGGGQNGAFGVGFLKGWRANTTLKRPTFDLVTGVSTGALIAPFAFLGELSDDATLEQLYLGVRKPDILDKRSDLALLFSNSMYTMKPLRRILDRWITADLVERIAAAHDQGRTLCVATVNMDYGGVKVWNITALAKELGPAFVPRFKTILMAAVAIPVAVPPVCIDGRMHVDAGVREQVFIRQLFGEVTQRRARARAAETQPSAPDTIFVIVNGKIGVPAQCVPNCLLPIAQRSVQLMLDEGMVGSLFRIYSYALAEGMLYYVVHVPSDVESEADSHAFNPVSMKRLFDRGYAMGRADGSWEVEPPTATDAERSFMRRNARRDPTILRDQSSRPLPE